MLGRHRDRLVQRRALDQAEPAHLLLGLGKRPVGEQQLAAAHPHRLALGGRAPPPAPHPHPAPPPPAAALVGMRSGALVAPDQQQKPHYSSLPHSYDESARPESARTQLMLTACSRTAPKMHACPLPVTRPRTWR